MASVTTQEPTVRFLPPPLALTLGVLTLVQAGIAVVVTGISPTALGTAALVLNLLCGALTAPAIVHAATTTDRALLLQRLVFVALWQGVVACYLLLIATRMHPFETAAVLQTALLLAAVNLVLLQLATLWPAAFPGIVFAWLVALPVAAYFFADLAIPAGVGYAEMRGAHADNARQAVHWILSLTPLTAAHGLLSGLLLDGSKIELWSLFGLPVLAVLLLAALLVFRIRPKIEVKLPAEEVVSL